ncbi:glycosyltransferase family 4 protein [Ferruginibacter yonginensis]|uniref:Glycosyltransferase family 4 protein n=1 Tax=Ferruginibacter yonginensis TaxID=1310416 RepID=A0ABV8QNQ3_9BACT
MARLAIITTHPIQYNAPLFQLLSQQQGLVVKVFYTWGAQAATAKYDPGFGSTIAWDIPLLSGYEYEFVENVATNPGSHHFKGIDNPSLIKLVMHWQPTAVLVYGWSFKSHLQLMRYCKGKVPVLFRGDSTLLDETAGISIKKIVRRFFLKWVYRYVDKALYVGTHNKAYFLKHGLQPQQLVYAPHAIDNDRFMHEDAALQATVADYKNRLQLAATDIVLLFSGKLQQKKDPFFMATLAAQLPNRRLKFLIVGDGALAAALQAHTCNDDRFRFLPFQNQAIMPAIYRLAHLFVLPSKGPGETWGLAINEALACGVPVVASQLCGGAIDLITENNGLLIDVQHATAAIAATKALVNKMLEGTIHFDAATIQHSLNNKHHYQHIVTAILKTVKP